MGIRHAVITSVDRDDLPDGGARHFAEVIEAIHARCAGVPPSRSSPPTSAAFRKRSTSFLRARPEVFSHNMETVPRLYRQARPGSRYRALDRPVCATPPSAATGASTVGRVKTGIMLGLGETEAEVLDTLRGHSRGAGVEVMTIGQYMQPTAKDHLPVDRWVTPEEFGALSEQAALEMGYLHCESGPLVRSAATTPTSTSARRSASMRNRLRASRCQTRALG